MTDGQVQRSVFQLHNTVQFQVHWQSYQFALTSCWKQADSWVRRSSERVFLARCLIFVVRLADDIRPVRGGCGSRRLRIYIYTFIIQLLYKQYDSVMSVSVLWVHDNQLL